MTVNTGGPVRGFLGRWLMRFEASGQIFNMAFLGITAASTFTSALALVGAQELAPYVLIAGVLASILFAFIYVEYGIYNRKNREKQDRGNNFAKPQNAIDDAIIARTILAAEKGRTLDDGEREIANKEALQGYYDFKDGIDFPE